MSSSSFQSLIVSLTQCLGLTSGVEELPCLMDCHYLSRTEERRKGCFSLVFDSVLAEALAWDGFVFLDIPYKEKFVIPIESVILDRLFLVTFCYKCFLKSLALLDHT